MKRYVRNGWALGLVLTLAAGASVLVGQALGEIKAGETVSLPSIGSLSSGDSLVITFDVVVENSLTFDINGEATISHQGTVRGSNFGDILTDDPDTPAALDPTATLVIDDSVPVLMQSFSASSVDDGVLVAWEIYFDHPDELTGISVQRGESRGGPFQTRTITPLEPSRSMSFRDAEVIEGTTYWYRLLLAQPDGVFATEPVVVQFEGFRLVTGLFPPRLEGPSAVRLRYVLAEAGPAVLEIFDVAGRRVRSLDQGARPIGEHEQAWDLRDSSGTVVARGVYIVRLTAGRSAASRKLLLAR